MMKESSLYICALAMAMLFAAILSETVKLYPNIFYNVAASLAATMNFMKVIGPGHFFPKLAAVTMLVAVFTIIANLKNRTALKYVLASFILMALFEFLFFRLSIAGQEIKSCCFDDYQKFWISTTTGEVLHRDA
jgi:hypothetical protein